MFKSYYALRWKILKRDNFTCQYCGQHAPNVHLEVDHIQPVAEGGDTSEENLTTACFACNRGKSALSIIIKRKGISVPVAVKPILGGENLLLHFLKGTDRTVSEIAEVLGWKKRSVNPLLSNLKKDGLVVNVARGLWHLIEQPANY